MDTKEWYRMQMAAAVHFEDFTGYPIDMGICDLLTSAAFDYLQANTEGRYSDAQRALESTLSYVNTEMDEQGYEAYVEGFEDCISAASDGHYDDQIDFESGLFPRTVEEFTEVYKELMGEDEEAAEDLASRKPDLYREYLIELGC